jgi:hypothetical protein
VGASGFLFGRYLAVEQGLANSLLSTIIYSLAAGFVGILLVYYLKRITIALAGFIAGVYLTTYLPDVLGWQLEWLTLLIAVIIGFVFAFLIFYWNTFPLIIVSSLLGATLIAQYLNVNAITPTAIFFTFLALGILTQIVLLQYSPISESA